MTLYTTIIWVSSILTLIITIELKLILNLDHRMEDYVCIKMVETEEKAGKALIL